jgi:hypothetical protein
MSKFFQYNIVMIISFIISYFLCVLFIDIWHYPAYLIVLIVSIVVHFARYPFMYADGWISRLERIAGRR